MKRAIYTADDIVRNGNDIKTKDGLYLLIKEANDSYCYWYATEKHGYYLGHYSYDYCFIDNTNEQLANKLNAVLDYHNI